MAEYRGAYDLTEVAFIEEAEATQGTTPTAGAWKPIPVVTAFDPKFNPKIKRKVGLGNFKPVSLHTVKKEFTLDMEMDLVAKSSNPAFEWLELAYYAISNSTFANTFALTKRLKTISVGAKYDLATDEYELLKGCMINKLALSGSAEDENPLKMALNFDALNMVPIGTTDYVSGTATRNNAVSSTQAYITMADVDIQVNAGSA